ncbi:MAG: thioredoxin family protein [Bacteriovoracaceae bacterium]|nr:thioredoxin family protein [Bacteroidota bacterium]
MKNIIAVLLFIFTVSYSAIPAKIENFSLNDYNGKSIALTDFKDAKLIVLMFISTECPVSNAYNERMAALYNDYKEKNVTIVGINSNKAETAEDIKTHAQEHEFGFPILKDVNNVIADKLNANNTPEIFVVHPSSLEVLYHGRIDDSQREAKVKTNDLRIALEEILAGKAVTIKDTKAFGCTIKRVTK